MPARQHRVTRGDDYRRIVRSGNRVGGALCIAHAVLHTHASASNAGDGASAEEAVPARFGFIISKAVGGAVVRNRVRRRMKYIVEQRLHLGFRGADVVFRALPAIAAADFAQLDREVNRQLDRIERTIREAGGTGASAEAGVGAENRRSSATLESAPDTSEQPGR